LTLLGVIAVALLNRLATANPAQAQRAETRRWEYCAIVGTNYDPKKGLNGTSTANVVYFTDSGRRFETIDSGRNNDPMVVAKLGAEGWEMVGSG
jgi:hypothetical protein